MGSHKDRRSSPLHPGQRDPSQARVPNSLEQPRESVKDATKHPPGKPQVLKGLQAKLEERRSAEQGGGAALQPFRNQRGPSHPETQNQEAAKRTETADKAASDADQIVSDEDKDLQDGIRSPGLNGLG